ncbi:MAG TPA: cysteine desulfurase family protein [Polyangia bacterium]|jgi:cysteine desulfurase|nr:cysteine desulfurase family protein [Polyangia bacterium]
MIYLDNAASTAPTAEVMDAQAAAAREHFGNPSSAHGLGAAAARAIEEARSQVAQALGADSACEIVFTSGGTEADALGVLGAAGRTRGRHLVVSAIEHPAVLRTAEALVAQGFALTTVAPASNGAVDVEAIAAALRPDTAVVALMLANNELGTLQPVRAVAAALARAAAAGGPGARRPHLHVDAVQAFGFVSFRAPSLGADTIAISGHKIHGPKGAGALWVRPGVTLRPLWDGGRQERGLRSGTENLPGWVGLGRAAARAAAFRDGDGPAAIAALRDGLEEKISAAIAGARPTVSGAARAPHISSMIVGEFPAEAVLHALEARGVYASAGSACASRTRGPSHVLRAVGVGERTAVLRFSLSRDTTAAEIDDAVAALRAAIAEVAPTVTARRRR